MKKRSIVKTDRFKTKKIKSNNISSILLIFISVLFFIVIGFFYFNQPKSLTTQLCPAEGPNGYALILFDLTDPITAQQASSIEGFISDIISEASTGTYVSVGMVGAEGEKLTPLFQMCKPPTVTDTSLLMSNPRMIMEKYNNKFLNPFNKIIKDKIYASSVSLPSSLILESMQSLIAQSQGFQKFNIKENKYRNVIVISDLMQHSKLFSFYRNDNWDTFVKKGLSQEMSSSLKGASITLLEITRKIDAKYLENRAVFWNKYFDKSGVSTVKHIKIGTL